METMRTLRALAARLTGGPRGGAVRSQEPAAPPQRFAVARADAATPERRFVRHVVPSDARRTTRQRDGDDGEAFARRYLEIAGLTFVAANVRYRDGEIDLVMRDARGRPPAVLVFVEVRRRARASHGGAVGSITHEKRRRIVAAAAHFMVGLALRALPPCRFDVVAVDGDREQGFRVEWIRDAFRDEG